jgi:hypothetical protein
MEFLRDYGTWKSDSVARNYVRDSTSRKRSISDLLVGQLEEKEEKVSKHAVAPSIPSKKDRKRAVFVDMASSPDPIKIKSVVPPPLEPITGHVLSPYMSMQSAPVKTPFVPTPGGEESPFKRQKLMALKKAAQFANAEDSSSIVYSHCSFTFN